MRLIDADAAATRITENLELVMGEDQFGAETIAALVRNALKSERITPTIDPVRYAVWKRRRIDLGDGEKTVWECSRCGTKHGNPTWYCHYCGASMSMMGDEVTGGDD